MVLHAAVEYRRPWMTNAHGTEQDGAPCKLISNGTTRVITSQRWDAAVWWFTTTRDQSNITFSSCHRPRRREHRLLLLLPALKPCCCKQSIRRWTHRSSSCWSFAASRRQWIERTRRVAIRALLRTDDFQYGICRTTTFARIMHEAVRDQRTRIRESNVQSSWIANIGTFLCPKIFVYHNWRHMFRLLLCSRWVEY